jgi:tartrate dehydrogenase/decarboxylase/D-malate dehydrogenase
MLDHLGLGDEATKVMRAIEATTSSGVLTPDLGGTCTTSQVTDAILANLPARASPRHV